MDYEKLHKDTINKLQQMVNSGKITVETARGICADFVPESEDERIRKRIIQAIHGDVLEMSEIKEAVAWLEKQGKNNMGISEATKQKLEYNLNKALEKETAESLNAFLEKQGEQKPWSEEDEVGLTNAMWAIEQARTIAKDENDMGNLWYAERWLKSFIPQNTWKPSEEQMKALDHYVNDFIDKTSDYAGILKGLFEQLKAL